MILGIDASNIRGGGTVNHLVELLRAADPPAHCFSRVIVWSGLATLNRIEDRPWLIKSHHPPLDKSLFHRSMWQRCQLSRQARMSNCDVLFVPGGSFAGNFRPMLTMSQNLLPFDWHELRRFGWSWMTVKLTMLRIINTRTFRRADGCIFLTRCARDVIMKVIKRTAGRTTIIPLGVGKRFVCPPREQLAIHHYSNDRPFRILYVSTVDMYKHQWQVADAVGQLRREGMPVVLDLIGPAYAPAMKRLRQTMERVNTSGECVRYIGAVSHHTLDARYAQADLCVFASTCESMPNILLEGMAAGLPIACSNRGPMPEMLGDGGVYFDPESTPEMIHALRQLIASPELRTRLAQTSFERSHAYSWSQCARETFSFLAEMANNTHSTERVSPVYVSGMANV